MHRYSTPAVLFFLTVFLAGCSGSPHPERNRIPWDLSELTILALGMERGYFQADKGGGFLEGLSGEPARWVWSVDGVAVATGWDAGVDGELPVTADTTLLSPDRTEFLLSGGRRLTLTLLDALDGHNFLLAELTGPSSASAAFRLRPTDSFAAVPASDNTQVWKSAAGGYRLFTARDVDPEDSPSDGTPGKTRYLMVCVRPGGPQPDMDRLFETADSMKSSRRARMERLLNRTYLRISDTVVTRAVRWAQLSLDALVVEGRDTILVPGLPWQGEEDGRAGSQSLSGIDLSLGTYGPGSAVVRRLASLQDTVHGSRTEGRIPDYASATRRRYGGADVTPWFVRETYDHVSRSNDTGLVRQIYPAITRSVEGTMGSATDSLNLLVHRSDETWMSPSPAGRGRQTGGGSSRGNRAAEIQVLWYFQQTAASFMARFMGDYQRAERWDTAQGRTAEAFNERFIDTTRWVLADHLTTDGLPVFETRPNGLLCLDLIWYDGMRTETVRRAVHELAFPHGVGTLAPSDARFRPFFGPREKPGRSYHDGPVHTWLAGHLVYALTRYDNQDFSYRITSMLARRILDHDVAGALPEAYDAVAAVKENVPRAAGRRVSAPALAEFVRSMYQDYCGVRVDASSAVITVAPRLPLQWTDAEFSVYAGETEVRVAFKMERGRPRLILESAEGARELKVQVLWTMPGGDGWRGSLTLPAASLLWVDFGEDDAEVYQDGSPGDLTGKWRIRNFSRRSELSGLSFVSVPQH